jgi:hypothetical protein
MEMGILNQSEAETFQRLLDGEELWSWPNGTIQLGQSFPDPAVINRLVRNGLLDQHYQPTEAGRSALQSWLEAKNAPFSMFPARASDPSAA